MKILRSLLLIFTMVFVGCASSQLKVSAPSVQNVRANIQESSQSVETAKQASVRSGEKIRAFRGHAEVIDYKAIRALQILD